MFGLPTRIATRCQRAGLQVLSTEGHSPGCSDCLRGLPRDVKELACKFSQQKATRQDVRTAYEDCHEMSKSWPASSLNRRPLARMFGLPTRIATRCQRAGLQVLSTEGPSPGCSD